MSKASRTGDPAAIFLQPSLHRRIRMTKSLTIRLIAGATMACLSVAALLVSPSAMAGKTSSQGGGVKCYWLLVSSNPATNSNVYNRVCRKGGA